MFRKPAIESIHIATCKLFAVLLVFSSASPAFVLPAPYFADDPEKYEINPSSGAAGAEYFVTIFSSKSSGKITGDTRLVPPGDMTVGDVTRTTASSLKVKIKVPTNTPLGKYVFLLKDSSKEDAKIIGTTEFEVTAIAAGPIPPGMKPEVDIMWGVMSTDVAHHNFGHKIANNYYAIILEIGNNSGYDLQIAGVSFRLRRSKAEIASDPNAEPDEEPANPYRATRGSLEREQEVGIRASIINAVKSLGNLYSGFLPFWHFPNHRANAALFGDILNGPFEAGLERVFPDTTVRQMTRLDDLTLRDGLVIKNNSQPVVRLVFFAKRTLNLSKDSGKLDTENPRQTANITDWRNDPQYVKRRLGALVLIGQTVAFINRVQVVKSSESGPVTPPPSVLNPDILLKQGAKAVEIVFPGDHLENAKISPPPGLEFPSGDIRITEDGHILRAKANVADNIEPGDYTVYFSSAGGRSNAVSIKVVAEAPQVTSFDPPSDTTAPTQHDVSIKITGKFLKGCKIAPKKIDNVLEVPDAGVSASATEFTQKIKVLPNAKKGKYTLEVQGPGGKKEIEIEIK